MDNYSNNETSINYVIVTPAKDEAKYILNTIISVTNQTIKPLKWIIIDDGSVDDTAEIVRHYCNIYDWIHLIQTCANNDRSTGSAEIVAFNRGYKELNGLNYQYIVKLDGDVELEKKYFEKLFSRFRANINLGIASGIYHEMVKGKWEPVEMPDYHAAGASKVIRKRCFEQLGGFLSTPGWDTVDEIKALYGGWETAHFDDIHFYHLKPEGSGMGYVRTNMMHGEISYLTGGGKLFFTLKLVHRSLKGKPFIIGGIMMLLGFLKAMVSQRDLLVTNEEAKFYRGMLNKRIFAGLNRFRPEKLDEKRL